MDKMSASTTTEGDHFFEADGIFFHYRVGGEGPLVVAHSVGWGMPAQYLWNGLGPRLEKDHKVVYFEPRGNGQSSQPADETTMSSKVMAEDIEHLRQHLDLDAFPVLLGHSNGACIVLRYAEQHPSRVTKLALIDAEIHDSPPNDNFKQWMEKRKDDPIYGPAVAALAAAMKKPPQSDDDFATLMGNILPYYFSDPANAATLSKHIEHAQLSVWTYLHQSSLDRKPENVLPHVVDGGKVLAKTLVIWGDEDAVCSVTAARAVAEAIPEAKLVMIEGIGHVPWIEKPDVFWSEMDMFIRD
jgi:pimeloyl-ACP methyl ester carboxylesterase